VSESRLLGIRIASGALSDLIAATRAAIAVRQQRPYVFACANPHSLVVARSDPEFKAALESADVVIADGVGCQWAGLLSGIPVGPRITGSDYFMSTMAALDRMSGRAFFFGSSGSVLSKIIQRVNEDFPQVTVGALSPPFRAWSQPENENLLLKIRDFDPDVLWVGMTAPKQEKWVAANLEYLGVPVIASIGAVFDYYARVTIRAPQWLCDMGLEWLYRLPREPKRLWKRTFVSAPVFLWHVLLERARR
jgi:N-acetylglucosaminyldiphosphoundecaprenol N-acetyl-beta-D-mannosaminyltransferase